MIDLGVIFENNLEFKKHLDINAYIKRSANEFEDINAILSLYKSIIKAILCYGSIIWTSHYGVDLEKLEAA